MGTSIAATLRESGFGGKKTLPNHGTAKEEFLESVMLADEHGVIENGLIKEEGTLEASNLWKLPEYAKRNA